MISWISQNIANIVICFVLIFVVSLAVAVLVRNKRKGKSSCGCNCSGCAMSGACHSKK